MAPPSLGPTPQVFAYCCTFFKDPSLNDHPTLQENYIGCMDRYLSILRLTEPPHRVSHIVIGQWHWAPDRSTQTLYLNDFSWDPSEPGRFPPDLDGTHEAGAELMARIFEDVKAVQKLGIKVLAQIQDFWHENGFGDDKNFEMVYGQIHRMLKGLGLDGVELDMEDRLIDNAKATRVIKRLRQDFPDLIITIAPTGEELIKGNPQSSVDYEELYKSLGSEIAAFHVQLYENQGALTLEDFESYAAAGGPPGTVVFPPEKLFLMVQTNPKETGGGHPKNKDDLLWKSTNWTSGSQIAENWGKILDKYQRMGGLGSADWYNAVWEPVDVDIIDKPEEWFDRAFEVLRLHVAR